MSNPRSLMSLKRLEPPAKHHDKGHRWSSQDERKVCQGLWHQRWCVWDPWLRCCLTYSPHVLGGRVLLSSQDLYALLPAAWPGQPHALPPCPVCRASTEAMASLEGHIIWTQDRPDTDL